MKATTAPAAEHTASSPAFYTGKQGSTPFFGPATENETPFFAPRIQTKLTIGRPGDKYEQEADAVADRVVQRLANPGAPIAVQKKCQDCAEKEKLQRKEEEREEPVVMRQVEDEQGETPPVQAKAEKEEEEPRVMRQTENEQEEAPPVQAKEKEEEEKPGIMRQAGPEEGEPLQTKAEAGASSTPSLQSRLSSAKGSGAPMDKSARAPMEAAFGQDFGRVRIHTDSSSAQMNRELNARAFTHGRDIYFNAGEYSPESLEGKKLIAHELTHVNQQKGNNLGIQRRVAHPKAKSAADYALKLYNQTHPMIWFCSWYNDCRDNNPHEHILKIIGTRRRKTGYIPSFFGRNRLISYNGLLRVEWLADKKWGKSVSAYGYIPIGDTQDYDEMRTKDHAYYKAIKET